MAKTGTAVPWSHSSLKAFETCPKRFYLTRISKEVKEPQTEATLHGNDVHRALEKHVLGETPLPEKYQSYAPIADRIKAAPGEKLLEYRFGLTKALKPTTFFGADVWLRGALDVAIIHDKHARVLDYKTGNRKVDADQLRLFAGAALALWPYVEKVTVGYVWLKENKVDTEVFAAESKAEIFQEFAGRVFRIETAEKEGKWPARPSGLCREWCPVGKKLCEHCGV